MAIKDILVHVDNTPACAQRMELATRLARQHEAHLVALFARAFGNLPNLSSGHDHEIDRQREASQQRFERMTSSAGITAEWRVADCRSSIDLVTEHVLVSARHVDLVIVGQHDSDKNAGGLPDDLAESVVLGGGRPVLVVPYAGQFDQIGQRVLVAWNGSREAVRAVNDAIPLLTGAKRVGVLALNPGDSGRIHGDLPSADICLHLSRHGIRAEAQTLSARDIDAGDMLLSCVADDSADLLVMGAYGQPRFREMVLGGATRQILKQMTVPVLMSH